MTMTLYTLFALAVMFAPSPAAPTNMCNRTILVECFVDSIDEFSQVLWTSRTNVVVISDADCVHVQKMGECLYDRSRTRPNHGCTPEEVMTTSRTLSELMLHRQRVGTFMKSYHLLSYACSKEGRQLIAPHRQCLMKESIGKATLSATTYLSEKYFEHQERTDICAILRGKMTEYKSSLATLCDNKAAAVMCESVTRAITGTYPEQTAGCQVDCSDMSHVVAEPTPTEIGKSEQWNDNGSSGGERQTSVGAIAVIASIVVAGALL